MLNILKNYEATENVDADTSSEKLDLATNHTLVLNEFLQQVDEVVAAENSWWICQEALNWQVHRVEEALGCWKLKFSNRNAVFWKNVFTCRILPKNRGRKLMDIITWML